MAHGGEKSTKTKGFAYWRWGFTYYCKDVVLPTKDGVYLLKMGCT